ncbi:hypothetical protein AB0L13_15785 [Saccharopolyspora shandongensis]|uniref:hypothetical protein n=1 Tax=Saccharopolyspora shandongensis TaxID=418495 RepID=UPI003443FC18
MTWSAAQEFVADPGSAGRPFAGRYTLITTSGTTGAPGIFVVDQRALAVNVALASRMRGSWLSAAGLAGAVALRIRLTCAAGADAEEVWRAVLDGVARALADRGLGGVDLQRAAEPPRQGRGGKFRTAIPFDPAQQGESSHDGKP